MVADAVPQHLDPALRARDLLHGLDHLPAGLFRHRLPVRRALLLARWTPAATVWRVVAESDEGRWMGLLEQAPRAGGLSGSGASTMLEWERIPEDEGW